MKGCGMTYFEWDESFALGIDEIDAQHRRLVRLVNEYHQAVEQGQGAEAATETLNQLIEYVRYHFTSEEHFMLEHDYPDIEAHRRQHIELTESVIERKLRLDLGRAVNPEALLTFLKKWLSTHLQITDQEYAKFIRQNSPV